MDEIANTLLDIVLPNLHKVIGGESDTDWLVLADIRSFFRSVIKQDTEPELSKHLHSIWKQLSALKDLQTAGSTKRSATSDVLEILCALTPDIVATKSSFNIKSDEKFWGLIEKGLLDAAGASKKFASYLLKSSTESSPAWENFYLMLNALDDSHSGFLKPLWQKMDVLLTGVPFRWVSILFKKAFQHPNYPVKRQVIVSLLNMDSSLVRSLPLDFVLGPFFDTLVCTSNLYWGFTAQRHVEQFSAFFKNFLSLPGFTDMLLQAICKRTSTRNGMNSGTSVVFMCSGAFFALANFLAKVATPITLSDTSCKWLSEIFRQLLPPIHWILRANLYRLLLETLFLSLPVDVSCANLSVILSVVPSSVLVPGSGLWKIASNWVTKFCSVLSSKDLVQMFNAFMTCDPSVSAGLQESRGMALLVALVGDFEYKARAELVVTSLANICSRMFSHPYLVPGQAERCLSFLTSWLSSSHKEAGLSHNALQSLVQCSSSEILSYIGLRIFSRGFNWLEHCRIYMKCVLALFSLVPTKVAVFCEKYISRCVRSCSCFSNLI